MIGGAIEQASAWLVNTQFTVNPLVCIVGFMAAQWAWNRRGGKR